MMRKILILSFALLISLLFSLLFTSNTIFAAEYCCCCDSGFHYDPSQPKGKRCVAAAVYVPPQPINCADDEYCIPDGRGMCSDTPPPPAPGITCDLCGCDPRYPGQKSTDCYYCNYDCYDCVFRQGNSWTALGCVTTSSPQDFIAWLLARALGIAGGIAFLLMIFASFQILTSSGDPQKFQGGKQLLTSAVAGLLMIIFSLFLLRLIGVQILKIPGFGAP